MPVRVSQEHGEEMEKEVHNQFERLAQRPVDPIPGKVRQCIGKGSHGGEEVNQDDEKDDPQRIDPVADAADESAGLPADADIDPADHDQHQSDQPGDGGLFEVSGEALPELFEGVDGVFGAQHLEHGVMQGGKGGACRHHRHGEKDEQYVRRDDCADAGHDAPEQAVVTDETLNQFVHCSTQ